MKKLLSLAAVLMTAAMAHAQTDTTIYLDQIGSPIHIDSLMNGDIITLKTCDYNTFSSMSFTDIFNTVNLNNPVLDPSFPSGDGPGLDFQSIVAYTLSGNMISITIKIEYVYSSGPNVPFYKNNPMCMIGFEPSVNKFRIIIDNVQFPDADSFYVYKETFSGFEHVGSIPADSTEFIDQNSIFTTQQTYFVTAVSNCDSLFEHSYLDGNNNPTQFHRSLFLQTNVQNSAVNLSWNKYVIDDEDVTSVNNMEFIGYYIYRGVSGQPLQLIDSVSLATTSYIDVLVPSETVYQIEAIRPSCDPFAGMIAGGTNGNMEKSGGLTSTRSNPLNIATNASIDENIAFPEYKAWVNNGNFHFTSLEQLYVQLYSIDGKQIHSAYSNALNIPINASIIVCRVSDGKTMVNHKIINVKQ